MDDLLALLEEEEDAETLVEPDDRGAQRPVDLDRTARTSASTNLRPAPKAHERSKPTTIPPEQQQYTAAEKLALSVDDRIGIRMINRQISGMDLLQLISENPYHSTATLAASSLVELNRLLVDPAAVVDVATVSGKTNLVTVGLVFSNSGTRMAASGNAFCSVQIGNLQTGPIVSVMLFGSSYSRHCRSCGAGKVVALVNPRLLPTKLGGKDSAAITFAVSDDRQMVIVGEARDFGYCKGTVRGKNERGVWVNDAMQCRHFVDKRVTLYCQKHRQQARNGATLARGGTSSTALEQLRQQAKEFPTAQGNPVRSSFNLENQLPPRGGLETTRQMLERQIPKENSILNPGGPSRKSVPKSMSINHQKQEVAQHPKVVSSNSILNPQKPALQINRNTTALSNSNQTSVGNPYAKPLPPRGPAMVKHHVAPLSSPVPTHSFSRGRIVTGDILQKAAKKADPRRRRAVNTDTLSGFNGSVQVPGPSKIFTRAPSAASHSLQSAANTRWKHEKSVDVVLARQQQLAAKLREYEESNESVLPHETLRTKKQAKGRDHRKNTELSMSARESLLFGHMGDIDMDQVLAAKSRFANQADAEEYARSRRIVTELEAEEDKKTQITNKKSSSIENASQNSVIEKDYHCLTCKRTFPQKPSPCIRNNHTIKVKRRIRASKTKADERQELTDKAPEDGGLKLSSGLDWSRNRFS